MHGWWETELGTRSFENLHARNYETHDLGALVSGSGQYGTMIIIPCSMGTLGRIAQGISNDLNTERPTSFL